MYTIRTHPCQYLVDSVTMNKIVVSRSLKFKCQMDKIVISLPSDSNLNNDVLLHSHCIFEQNYSF